MSDNPYLDSERHRLHVRTLRAEARDVARAEQEARLKAQSDAALIAAPEHVKARLGELSARRGQAHEADEQAQREFAARFMRAGAHLPDAQAVANALTEAHAGGPPVGFWDMLIEAGSAHDRASALTQASSQHGRAVVDCLRALSWTQTRRSRGILWKPPERA